MFSDWFEYCTNLVSMLFSKPYIVGNVLLQALIDMRSGNYENKWGTLFFIIREVYLYASLAF